MSSSTSARRVQPLPEAIILSAGTNALGAVRSLHLAGVQSIALAQGPAEPVLDSRFPVLRVAIPSLPQAEREGPLLESLDRLRDTRRRVLIPTSDFFVSLISRHREQLSESFDFCLPSPELTSLLLDKAREVELIESVGIPLPVSVLKLPPTWEELRARLRLPIIVKPRTFAEVALLGRKNVILRTEEEGREFYQRAEPLRDAVLAQEVVPGEDDTLWVCNCSFNAAGEMVEGFTFRRLRLTPAHFGVTSYAESIYNPEVLEQCRRLGAALGYKGPAMIEFKLDARDGVYRYIEINPRIGLCNYFDTRCGINNVLHAYQLARGVELRPTNRRQKEGVMYLEFVEDLLCRWQTDHEPLWRILQHYASHAGRPHVGAYWDWRDPWPGLRYALQQFSRVKAVGRKLKRRLAGQGQ